MNHNPRTVYERQTVQVDGVTGEVLNLTSERTTVKQFDQEPPYVKLYLDTVLYLKDLPQRYGNILFLLLNRIPWASANQSIAINAFIKREIATELGCSVTRIDHALSDFVKGDILKRVGTGTYQFNPHLFGRGEWKDIAALRLTIDFDSRGKTMMSEVRRKRTSSLEYGPNQVTMFDEPSTEVTTFMPFMSSVSAG